MDPLFEGSGGLRGAYAAVAWERTPLGPVAGWSEALRAAVDLVLRTRLPVTLLWGPDLVLVYNEAYVPLIADKHPRSLGARAQDVFPEAWHIIGPLLHGVREGGPATWVEDSLVPLELHGRLVDRFFTFSYSGVRGADGQVEGVLDLTVDTTDEVVTRRRLALLTRLTAALASVDRMSDLPRRAVDVLASASADLVEVEVRLPGARTSSWGAQGRSGSADAAVLVLPLAPVRVGAAPGSFRVRLGEGLAADDDDRDFVALLADALSLAVSRLRLLEAERAAAAGERSMAEAVQRSLLSRPVEPDHLQLAVRYVPAAPQHRLGGDWYDAFMRPGGATALVIGDVAGHDQESAIAMAQVRNVLRGVACTVDEPPAGVLARLDTAMRVLAIDVLATVVMAQVEQDGEAAEAGTRTLRWSNAGHLPPVLVPPGGAPRMLSREPEPLVGLGLGPGRTDHEVELEPGATLVLCTDGLVERRGTPLADSLEHLLEVVARGAHLSAEALCDHLLAELGPNPEDDVALLVLRAHAEDAPRPPEAGPEVLPEDLRTT